MRDFRLPSGSRWDLRSSGLLCSVQWQFLPWISWLLKMGPTGCPETSVRNCHYRLRNSTEEGTSHVICYRITIRNVIRVKGKTECSCHTFTYCCGPGSVVGIATGYGLDGPWIEFRWGRDFSHLSRPTLGPTQPPVQWVPGLSPGVKSGRSVTLIPHLLLVPWSRKSRAILLLPLWAVQPVQSLSVCTRGAILLYVLLLYIDLFFLQDVLFTVIGVTETCWWRIRAVIWGWTYFYMCICWLIIKL
jgi:hypothetical protein